MDKVTFDEDGLMYCTVTDTPQPAPLAKNAAKSIPVTINKMRAMNALSKASSEQPGFYASYAVDDYSGTLWLPAADDRNPSLTIELSPATRFDVVQLFKVDGMRVLFGNNQGRRFRGPLADLPVYQYKLEVSMDGEKFTTVLDKTGNKVAKDTVYEDFDPVTCRFVRLTVTGWPKDTPLGIIDFTVFGNPDGHLPAAVATPTYFQLPLDKESGRL